MDSDRKARLTVVIAVALMLSLAACRPDAAPAPTTRPSALYVLPWRLPVQHAARADLAAVADGSVLLSWVETVGDAEELRFARWRDGAWTAPLRIARAAWLGNAIDMPHVRQTADGTLWATWPARNARQGHARDVVISRSSDEGMHWAPPVAVNDDGTATEHGFVSAWPASRDRLGVAWLDGRAKAGQGVDATALRMASFGPGLARADDAILDARTCDCCQTDIATADGQVVIAYRDREPDERRDIRLLRGSGADWSAPTPVADDGWIMAGCPMNGPAIASDGKAVAVAWFTMADDRPRVRLALAPDGARFARTVELDAGAAVTGQVDIALHGGASWSTWLRSTPAGLEVWIARLAADDASPVRRRLAGLASQGRPAAPRLLSTNDGLLLLWEDVHAGRPTLQAAKVEWR